MKIPPFITFALLLAAGLFPTLTRASLDLHQALALALERSPVYDAARKLQEVRELEYRSAVSKFLPSADASATHGLQTSLLGSQNPTNPWASTLSLGLTETLYDNGVSLTRAGIARLNLRLAEIDLDKARDTLAINIATEYYNFSALTLQLQARLDQQTLIEKQARLVESQYHQGYKMRSDFLRIRALVQRAEIDRISAENDLKVSRAELARLIGTTAVDLTELAPLPVGKEPQIPAPAPAFEGTFEAREAALQTEINSRAVSFAERNYWPQLNLTSALTYGNGSYLGTNAAPFAANQQLSLNALLTVSFNLWDWGTRRRDVAVAERTADIQNDSVRGTLLQTHKDLIALLAELARVRKSFELSRDLLALEEETNGDLQTRYREGKVPYLDLVTSLASLLDARTRFYSSYFDLLRGAARYRYYEGKAYEFISSPQ
jgi:outer membrane protein TolC